MGFNSGFKGLMELKYSGQIFEKKNKLSNIKFHENPSRGSRVVPCGQTDRQADMTKLTAGFGNFAEEPKYQTSCPVGLLKSTFRRVHIPAPWPPLLIGIFHGFPQPSTAHSSMMYSVDSFPGLTDNCRPNAPPYALLALRRTPRVGDVLTVDCRSSTNDRSYNNRYKI